MATSNVRLCYFASDAMRERLEVCTMGMVALLLFSLCSMAGRPPSISFIEKNIAVAWRGAACRRVRTSFPFPFASHYVLLVLGTDSMHMIKASCFR